MKYLLYGNAMILMGIVSLLISWIGEIQVFDVIGVILSIVGFGIATYGFFKRDK